MKEFNLRSGTTVIVEENKVSILRNNGKSAVKGLFAGRAMGQMVIKLSSISGMIQYADYMLICASGLPTPTDFKISNIGDIKQYPNCIVGKEAELQEVYDYINNLI